jgi:hypothetical protein
MPQGVKLTHFKGRPRPVETRRETPPVVEPVRDDGEPRLVVVAGLERMLDDAAKSQQGMLERIVNAITGRKPPAWKFTITYNEQGRPAEVLASPIKEPSP